MYPPRAVLFDLGGTVLRQVTFRPARWAEELRTLCGAGVPKPEEAARLVAEAVAEFHQPGKRGPVEVRMEACLRHLHERLGVDLPLSPAEVDLRFWQATSRMAPEPEARAVLEALQERGVATGMISNSMLGEEVLRWELARHDLADFFPVLLSSADYALRKPHPAMFRTALARLGLSPGEAWFVGDSFANDVLGAAGAGLAAVWYNRLAARPPAEEAKTPFREVRGWGEFLGLLA